MSALDERDKQEKAGQDIFNAYNKLADRAAILEATSFTKSAAVEGVAKGRTTSTAASRSSSPEALARLRQDLSEAQRTKGEQQSRLNSVTEELERLKLKSRMDAQRISELATEKATLVTRMRDRDEELREKAKLLENVHDETVSLTLQLNMAEERLGKLQRENKDLVDRWMARMSQEADAMNNASRFS
ncbi:Autophagy-related protein 16 [Lasallia pustulata]|uniref:Autophagy-related protein 16 n=1 Tax=Lasallia pustulata TaxID=136370 RepID=A0A1W5D5J5_9LECA|nr:Autophagy-related protein 16 [Lasallia pustulata]